MFTFYVIKNDGHNVTFKKVMF